MHSPRTLPGQKLNRKVRTDLDELYNQMGKGEIQKDYMRSDTLNLGSSRSLRRKASEHDSVVDDSLVKNGSRRSSKER